MFSRLRRHSCAATAQTIKTAIAIVMAVWLCGGAAFAQGARYDSLSQSSATIAGTTVYTPASGATITVCSVAAISTVSESSTTVTVTTTAAHGFNIGQSIKVFGVGVSGYNGTFTVATTPTGTTFTYIDSNSGLGNSSGGGVAPNNTPCTPTVTLYTDQSLTVSSANPLTADILGNFGFWITPGTYVYTVTGTGITSSLYNLTLPVGGSPGAGNPVPFLGDAYFKSGRPWFDVMAFGAKNDGVTDDTAAIQAAITAACALSPPGGIIYFPRGAGYKTANTSVSPFTLSCNGLHFLGEVWGAGTDVPAPPSGIYGNSLTAPLFTFNGSSCGASFENLYLQGNLNNSGAIAISATGSGTCVAAVFHNFFDQWGGPCLQTSTNLSTFHIESNWAQNCLGQKNSLGADTGAFDLGNNDLELHRNFVSASTGLASGYITAHPNAIHAFAYVLRGTGGFASYNMGEISGQGWLAASTSGYITFNGNRALLNQGNGFINQGGGNIFTSNKSLTNSQDTTNAYDGFVCSGLCNGGMYSDNEVDDTAGGNGNHTRHGFTDSNGNGPLNITTRSKYSNNALGSGPLGVLYNFTGINFPAVTIPHLMSPDRGDNSVTLKCAVDEETQYFNTTLTNTRTVTFSSTGAYQGCRFRIVRTSNAASNFPVGTSGCTTCQSLFSGQYLDVEFFNGSFGEVAYGSLTNLVIPVSFTTTGVASETITVPGMTASGHCSLAATNTGAAGGIASFFLDTYTTNTVTFHHTATAGWTVNLLCTPN